MKEILTVILLFQRGLSLPKTWWHIFFILRLNLMCQNITRAQRQGMLIAVKLNQVIKDKLACKELILLDNISHLNYVFKRCDTNFNPIIYYCKSSSYSHM